MNQVSEEHNPQNVLTPDQWLELVETHDDEYLCEELKKHHPADIAAVIEQMPYDFQVQILSLLDAEIAR